MSRVQNTRLLSLNLFYSKASPGIFRGCLLICWFLGCAGLVNRGSRGHGWGEVRPWTGYEFHTYPLPDIKPVLPRKVMIGVVNSLGLKLLAIHNEHNENNIAISPYGALSILVALGEGLQGEAVKELQKAAHIPNDISLIRVGLRDIHRHLKSYFIPQEGFLAGLTLNHDNVTIRPEYEDILKFYGFDIMSFNSALYPNPPTTEKPTTLNPGREMTMEITRTTTEIGTTILETTTNLNREPQESTTVITTTMPAITSTANNANESTTITTTIETTVTSSIPEITADNTKENIPSTTTIITSTTEIKPTTEEIRDSITTGMIESTISDSPDTTTKMSVSTTQTTNEDENTEKSSQITTTELPFIQQTTEVRTTQQQIMEESTTTIPEKTEKTTTKLQTTTELLMTTEREQTTTEETITKQQTIQETTTNQQTIQEITTKQQTTQETTTNQQTTQEITTKQQTTQETTAEQQTPEETTTEGQITEETTTKKQLTEKITTEQQTTIETTTEQKHIEEPATEEIFTEETATEEIFTEETATEHKTTEEINTEQEISLAPESTLVSFPYPDASTPLPAMEITTQIMKENEINPTDEETNVTKRKIRSRKTYKNKRKPRSVLDYVIARYYDNYPPHQHGYPTNFPENYHLESYVPQTQPSFLVQGKYREYQVDYMKYDTVLPFFYVPYLKTMALSFPLDSDKYYLLLLLPLDVNGIDKLICDLRLNDSLKYIIQGLRYRHVVAVIPSFMLKGYVNLTPTLQKLGIRRVFEPRQADFSPMTNFKEIYITNIEQAITVNIRNYVDPDVLSNRGEYGREEPVEFRADHPFLYFVMDTELHVALMAGKIVNPLNSRIT